ncbi:hypothetical protein B0H14DRAFT_2562744 [Mycena olivaceomarginata]|nr:hypothetical protein B0H14DRAFT_2562744 [Mycena olivaceomarginata]
MAPIIPAAAANQPAFLYAFLIPVGLGLVPLLALFVRVVRKRRSVSASASCTAEDRRFPAWYEKGPRWIAATMEGPSTEDDEHSGYDDNDEAPRKWSSPRRKASSGGADSWDALTEAELEARRAAHLEHIRNNLSCWGHSWRTPTTEADADRSLTEVHPFDAACTPRTAPPTSQQDGFQGIPRDDAHAAYMAWMPPPPYESPALAFALRM